MKVTNHKETGGFFAIDIVLSERNLRALLAKLDGFPSNSVSTLERFDVSAGVLLKVSAEPDDVHYGHRKPGMLHPDTEAAIAEYGMGS